MIAILVAVLALLAVVAWVAAVIAAMRVVGVSPRGQRLRNYGRLGWWRFTELESDLGEVAVPHLRTYRRAFIAFMICVLAATAAGALLATQAQT